MMERATVAIEPALVVTQVPVLTSIRSSAAPEGNNGLALRVVTAQYPSEKQALSDLLQ